MLAYRPIMRLTALAAALAATAAMATNAPSGPGRIVVSVTLEPGKVHEACMQLERGDRRRYEWKASAAADFNIHYHRGNEVVYPEKRDGVKSWRGGFTSKSPEEYCWMWTARTKPAKIEGWIDR
jgi:hypothetical protein